VYIGCTYVSQLLSHPLVRTHSSVQYTYTRTHTHTHTYIHVHTHTHTHTYIHVHTYTHTRTYTRTYTHTRTYARTYIHTYTHTHTHILSLTRSLCLFSMSTCRRGWSSAGGLLPQGTSRSGRNWLAVRDSHLHGYAEVCFLWWRCHH
jgi:hypothetical protein